jgi:hypothetical protein
LIQPSALNPWDNAASLSGETVCGKVTQLFAVAGWPTDIARRIAATDNFRLQATVVHLIEYRLLLPA